MTKQEILEKLVFDLELRKRSEHTILDYQKHVRLFQDYFDKPADQMGEEEIRQYLHYLLTEKGNTPASTNVCNSALRYLYAETLDITLNIRKLPRIKTNRRIPEIPSKEELGYIFYITENIKHKAIFMTIYGSGLRISEAINLKVTDIDSKQNRIFIRSGKGDKDRFTLLPQKTLKILREYYRQYKPTDWLFISRNGEQKQLTLKAVQDAFKKIVEKSGIPKHITIHTLRHSFATHMFNEGRNILEIKKLLGHTRIDTTAWYLQMSDSEALRAISPLDTMKNIENDENS